MLDGRHDAHLWMVGNAPHHPRGDFALTPEGLLATGHMAGVRLTWASVGLFSAALFHGIAPGTRLPLRPLLERSIDQRRLAGTRWDGAWTDVGTPERLASLHHT